MSALSMADRAADAALVGGLASGDEAAAVVFVRRFQSSVFGCAFAITRDAALAEDVSQEAFLRAWRAAATYDARRGSVRTWLLTITHNAAVDAIRSRRPVAVTDDVLDSLLLGALGADHEERLLAHVECAQIGRHLRSLPPDQARAVVLAVIAGCTAAEVSAYERIPLGTAKTRVRSGLRKLRAALSGAPAEDAHRGGRP